jgi:succinate dehydrogenase / fumarate reductase flavoprotein subunit
LRNDGRVWAPKTKELAEKIRKGEIKASDLKDDDRDYFLERKYPAFGNLVPRDVASRNAKEIVDEGRGVGSSGIAVYLDFAESISRLGEDAVRAKYGNLFDMYQQITDENPYKQPMRIYPAVHYTMGGLWVDYNLQTTVKGLYCLGEANFSDHGANRLGASALMQGLADGYFVIPYTLGDYLATIGPKSVDTNHPAFEETKKSVIDRINKLISLKGNKTVSEYHRELGHIMWEYCGMARDEKGLIKAKGLIRELKEDFWKNAIVTGINEEFNQNLENAGRVADFLELGELMVDDALDRKESCGGHFRLESQTPEGEALRDDDHYAYAAAWEYKGDNQPESLHKEELVFENVKLTQRSYK